MSSRGAADTSPRAFLRTPPYPESSRGRSRSDGLLAAIQAPHQVHPSNSTVVTLASVSHSSQPPSPPELISGTPKKINLESSSQSQTTTFPESDFDSSSFDFAMAFAEASYSAQNSEDLSAPALNPNIDSITQPSSSPSANLELSPPDLFAPMNIIPLTPPPSGQVRRQSLRFPEDLYTRKAISRSSFPIRNRYLSRETRCRNKLPILTPHLPPSLPPNQIHSPDSSYYSTMYQEFGKILTRKRASCLRPQPRHRARGMVWHLPAGSLVGAQKQCVLVRQELQARHQRSERHALQGARGGETDGGEAGRGRRGQRTRARGRMGRTVRDVWGVDDAGRRQEGRRAVVPSRLQGESFESSRNRGRVSGADDRKKCHAHAKVQDTPKRRRESRGERGPKTMTPRRLGTGGKGWFAERRVK